MDPIVNEWLHMVLRWAHITAGIAWVGTSFFFNFLDLAVRRPNPSRANVDAEAWLIHAGAFYQMDKMLVNRDIEPTKLGWESQGTWFSGMFLLILIYYVSASLYLVDPASGLSAGTTIAIGVGSIVVCWFVYDLIWQSPLGKSVPLGSVVSLAALTLVTYGLYQVMSPRGALMHVGALLGTIMWANVRVRIIPAQVRMIADAEPGVPLSESAKQWARNSKFRSNHNNYITLPVLLVMIANHFPSIYAHQYAWLLVLALFLIGSAVRHAFNLHHKGEKFVWILPTSAVAMVAVFYIANPIQKEAVDLQASTDSAVQRTVSFDQVRTVVSQRCAACHSSMPTHVSFVEAPKQVVLDTPEQILAQVDLIKATTVSSSAMPLGNLTGMTDEERKLIGTWIEEGRVIR